MKRNLILLFILLVLNSFVDAKTHTKYASKKAQFYLTFQAENGSIKQKFNENGTITCIIKQRDVIRVSSIVLNGDDVTNQLEKNKYTLPVLTQNSTLEITFDSTTNYIQTVYSTIAMF